MGHDVTVFTPLYKPVGPESANYKIVRLKPIFKFGNAAYVPALKRYLKKFDIVHLHYPFFGGAEMVWRKRRQLKKRKIRIVLHYHMDVVGQGAKKMIFSFHKKTMLPKMVKMADKIILTSLDYGQNSDLAKFIKTDPEKFVEVPNGVDTAFFSPKSKDQALMAKLGLETEEKIILFVGALDKAHYFKGVEFLLEAGERLVQAAYRWRLLIVGQGDMKEYYESLANQLRIHKKTVFAGFVSEADLPKYYNLAEVVVLPSIDKSEAFGLVLVEAMACGKPVIASDLAGVRSVIDNGQNGLLCQPQNADDLAAKINYILTKPEQAESFARHGLIKARTRYDWKIIGQTLDLIYKQLK